MGMMSLVRVRDSVPREQAWMPPASRTSWLRVLTANLARGVLAVLLTMLICAVAPTALGWKVTTVMTGSMTPRIKPGDVVLAAKVDTSKLKVGQVLLVRDPDHPGGLRLHRYVGTDANGELILRGDANAQPDSTHIVPRNVLGVARLRVPDVGLPGLWLRQRHWAPLLAVIAALVGVIMCSTLDRVTARPRG